MQLPQDAVYQLAVVAPSAAASSVCRQQWRDPVPRLVGELALLDHRSPASSSCGTSR